MLFFNKGLIRHLIIWKTLHFKLLAHIWLSKVKASVLPKERWRKVFFSLPKVGAHNRVPSKQLYYWVTEPLMRYPPWKIVWMLFFNKGLIRHLIIWKTLHFKLLAQIWLSKVKASVLPKERWRKGFCFFFHSQKLVLTIEYHPNNYIIEQLSHSWGTPLKNCLGVVF